MSPTLPIGGFTYSQGIEKAVEDQWIVDVDSAYEWLSKQLHYGLTYTDLPIMLRLYNAFESNNKAEVVRWGQVLLACRETRELRQEEVNRGRALNQGFRSIRQFSDDRVGRYNQHKSFVWICTH